MPGCEGAGTAERSYRTSKVRGDGREELPCVRGWGGGLEDPPHIRGQGWNPRPRAAPEAKGGGREEQPHALGAVAAPAQEGLEEPSHNEGQEGSGEKIPLIQSKEQL